MAIDMIENNELGALNGSRLGNRQFIDEMPYRGTYVKKDEFANLFGSKKRKQSIADTKAEQNARWAALPVKTCGDIKGAITATQIEVEKLTKLSATSKDYWVIPALEVAREWEGKFKQMQASQRCLELEEEEKKRKERELTLQTLTNLSDATVEKAKQDIAQTGSSSLGQSVSGLLKGTDNNKLLIIGGVGLGAILLILLLRK